MDNKNVGLGIKSEPSSFLVQDYTPKNTISINRTGSKSSFIKEEKYEFNAPKYYDFEAGTPSTNVDSWFDTLVDTPCNKTTLTPSMMNSQEKKIFTTPSISIKETSINKINKNKGKEVEKGKEFNEKMKALKTKVKKENDENSSEMKIDRKKEIEKETVKEKEIEIEKEKEKEKENVNNNNKNANNSISSNGINKNLNNYINTTSTKLTNILSSWDTTDNNRNITQTNNNSSNNNNINKNLIHSFRPEIYNLKRDKSRKSTEENLELSNKMEKHEIIPPKSILTSKPINILRKDLFTRSEKIRTRPSETDENEKPVEFESRINNILKFKNTLRRQSKQYKRKLKLTIPKSPNITKAIPRRSRDNWIVQPIMEKRKPKISLEKLFNKPFEIQVPHRMLPLPKFSLSSDKLRQQQLSLIKQNLIKEQESDQQKTQFHASEASNQILSNRTNVDVVERLYHIKRNVPAIEKKEKVFKFKARPVPKSKPFIIKRIDKPLTEAISPILHSKIRAKERQIFDEKVHQHQLEMEKLQKEMEIEKEKREKQLIKQLRKKTVHHAKPAPNPNIVFRIKPSHQQLTIPKSPSFGHQRSYKSLQMNSIHRQMDRRLRSLSNESKEIKGRLRSLSNESMELNNHLRNLSSESIELNNHLKNLSSESMELNNHLRNLSNKSMELKNNLRNLNDDSRELDKNDLYGISYSSSSSSISKELHPYSVSSLKINDTDTISNKKSYSTTTSLKLTSSKPVASTETVSSTLSIKSIRKEVPTRSSSSSTLVSSSSRETSISPLISPVLHSKPSHTSSSESSSVTLKHSNSNSTIKPTSSKSSETPIVDNDLKPVKSEPKDNTTTSKIFTKNLISTSNYQNDNINHGESLFNSLAYDISKSSIFEPTTTSANQILSKSILNEQSSTSKVLKNIQQQQRQFKQQQDQENRLQQQKKQKKKQQEEEKQLLQDLNNKQEKEKLKKIMRKDYQYQGQEKFLQQVKQKQKVQEELLLQQKQKQKQQQEQEQLKKKQLLQQQEQEQLKKKQLLQQQEQEQLKRKQQLQQQEQEQLKKKQLLQQQEQEQLKRKQQLQQQEQEQQKRKQEQFKQKEQIQSPLKRVKKEIESSPKDIQKSNNTKSLNNTPSIKQEPNPNDKINSQKNIESEDNLLSSPPSLLDMFSPTKKRAKTRSKSFIDTNRSNNYSIHQKSRLSDVSMNIKQNILNDIMSFSPINASPSPFILSSSDRKKLKKRHLFDSPHPKKFEIARRESQYEHEQRRKSEFLNKILYGDKVKKEDEEKERKEKERSKYNAAKAESYKVQWITIDEIKKNKDSENNSSTSNLPFEITPIKASLSDLDTPRNHIPFDSNIYKTPENNIIHRKEEDTESNPFKDSSTKITTFISKVTRRTSKRLRQSLIN